METCSHGFSRRNGGLLEWSNDRFELDDEDREETTASTLAIPRADRQAEVKSAGCSTWQGKNVLKITAARDL
jgi:hypothetical protein